MTTLQCLTADLDALCRTAQERFHTQPRPVRSTLTAQTRSIFRKHAQHGNQARLRHNLKAFLETGDEGLTFAETSSARPQPQTLHQSTTSAPTSQNAPPASSQPASRSVDIESTELVPPPSDGGVEFHLDRAFVLDPDTKLPPDLLESIDRVFGLYAEEAKLLLSHHCEKYGNEPLFRAGVRELVMSRTDTLFQSISRHDLSLTPETQEFLFSVYERHPDLNTAEMRILVRATRLDEDTVEFFWDDMTERRKSYLAMRQLIAARELRELRAERARKPS